MIKIKFSFEYGNNFSCLWSQNDEAINYFGGYIIEHKRLGVTDELDQKLKDLCIEYQTSLNWEYPPDESPWNEEQKKSFNIRAYTLYKALLKQVNCHFEIIYDVFIP